MRKILLSCFVALALSRPIAADPPAPGTARASLPRALAAADAWADDARLVWVENDAALDAEGRAAAWGYLFYSPEKHALRSWSVRGDAIVQARDHAISAEAPAVDPDWRDSAEPARIAWEQGGAEFCSAGGGLQSLVLVRGVFAPASAWVAVFEAGAGPRLYVVVEARSGDVLKRWRG
jgi:hypothetical protein